MASLETYYPFIATELKRPVLTRCLITDSRRGWCMTPRIVPAHRDAISTDRGTSRKKNTIKPLLRSCVFLEQIQPRWFCGAHLVAVLFQQLRLHKMGMRSHMNGSVNHFESDSVSAGFARRKHIVE